MRRRIGATAGGTLISEPKVLPRVRVVLLVISALLAVVLVWLNIMHLRNRTQSADDATSGVLAWHETRAWDFKDGEPADGWGWGPRRAAANYLELIPEPDATAVYVLPIAHAPELALAAEVMLVAAPDSPPGSVHLMARDRDGTNHLGGFVCGADSDSVYVYHKVDGVEHLLEIAPSSVRLTAGSWHRLRFTCAAGAVRIHVDGEQVFAAAGPYPPGLYGEVYVAAEGGRVRLRRIQVLDVAPQGSAGSDGAGGGVHEH
jgi:hypothetical protein